MGRKKIGTALNDNLLTRARVYAAKENKHLNEIIEEAIDNYITGKESENKKLVVENTKGIIHSKKEIVQEVLEEEDFLEH